MKALRTIFSLMILLFSLKINALVITLSGMPDDYVIHRWDYNAGQTVQTNLRTSDINTYIFNVPDSYVVEDPSGKINLYETLRNWTRQTPSAPENPKTVNGVTRFPFTLPPDPSNPAPRTQNMYVALGEMLEDEDATKDFNISASDGREIDLTVPVTSLESALESYRGRSVNCESRSGNAAVCLICNCANEAGGNNEPHEGRVEANRTVLSRLTREGYPSTICGVIWAQNASRTSAAFSWTLGGRLRSRDNVRGSDMTQCVDASIDAVRQGPSAWDMFFSGAQPTWYDDFIHRGKKRVGGHTYMNSGARQKDNAARILESETMEVQGVN